MENLTVVSEVFWPCILGKYQQFQTCFQMENLTVVSTIFWPWILGILSMVSIFFFK